MSCDRKPPRRCCPGRPAGWLAALVLLGCARLPAAPPAAPTPAAPTPAAAEKAAAGKASKEKAAAEKAAAEKASNEKGAEAVRFGGAPQRLRAATAAGNWPGALAAAGEIRAAVSANVPAKGVVEWSDAEARAILEATSILRQADEQTAAAELARQVAAGTAGTEGPIHFEAAAVAWQLSRQLAKQKPPPQGAAEAGADAVGLQLLADAEAALAADDPLYHAIQELVLFGLGDSAETTDRLLQQMADAGVHVAVARLIEIHRANEQWRERQLDALEETLLRLRAVLEVPRVAPVWSAWWANQYGLLLQEQGRYAEATEAHRRAVELAAAAGQPAQQSTANDNLALLALRLGDYRRARRLLENSLSAPQRGADAAARWALRTNYAKALEGDQEYGQAQQELRELLEQPDGDVVSRATAENNLALSLFLVGDWEAAEQHWKSCRSSLSGAFPMGHPYLAEVEVNLAWLAMGRGKLDSAIERFERAAAQIEAQRGANDPRFAEVQTYLARALAANERRADARRLIDRALVARTRSLERTISAFSARDRLALTQELRVHAESSAWPGSFDTFLELAPELQIPVAQQYAAVLRWKSLLRRAEDRADDEDRALPEALLARRDLLRRRLHDEYFRPVSRLARAAQARQIAQLESDLQDVERSLAALGEQVRLGEPPQPAAIAEQLPAGRLLVDFIQYRVHVPAAPGQLFSQKSAYAAFVTRPGEPTKRIDLGSAAELDAAIATWRAALENVSSEEPKAAREVARRLWQPLRSLTGGASTLQICPDGNLFQVPWAALPVAEGQYLIDRVAISVVPHLISGTELHEAAPAEPRPPRLLLVGGVDYGPLRSQWPDLPGTRAEIEAVAKAFSERFPEGKIERLEGPEATEAAVLKALPKASHVHLATHGFYRQRGDTDPFGLAEATAPLNSGLVLAPAAAEAGSDQFLTADELGGAHLGGGSALWILSACETGLGRPQAGQGMVGLLTALDRAGARGTVASLWKVDDAATSRLMTEFYYQLWKHNAAPTEALRAAQLKLRRERGRQTAHPKYWAAFYFSAGSQRYR